MSSSSHKTILKSTSIIGGSQVIKIIFNVIQAKALAVLVGAEGVGLKSSLNSAVGLIKQIFGLGIGQSATREVAKKEAGNNQKEIAETILSLRRLAIILGLAGTIAVIVLRKPLSQFTFGNNEYATEIALLSIVVFFQILSGSYLALIQGKRQIKRLGKITILGAFYSTLFSIPIVYFWGLKGIVPYLVALSVAQFLTTYWFARKIKVLKIRLTLQHFLENSQSIVKLGLAFMGGELAMVASNYLIKVILIRHFDVDAVGFYQAANTLSIQYMGLILGAMSKDFYPRLTSVANKPKEAIKMINEQTEVGLILALPGLLFTLGLAPWLITVFYTAEFAISADILQWMILGVAIRAILWPMAFIFVAKGKGHIFVTTRILSHGLRLGLTYFLIRYFDLIGTGMAFFFMYFVFLFVNYILIKREIKFYWHWKVKKLITVYITLITAAFFISLYLPKLESSIIISVIAVITGIYSMKQVKQMLHLSSYKQLLNKFFGKK